MIAIIDYGMGNLHSVLKAFWRLKINVHISSDPLEIAKADKLILPGVGHFKNGMSKLHSSGIVEVLEKRVIEEKVPILGICLGMQLFSKHSEEGDVDGLGWIDAETVRFDFPSNKDNLPIPHIGWNTISGSSDCLLFKGLGDSSFYFVHSYHVKCADQKNNAARTEYGIEFTSAVQCGNIFGTQFHPEKSHKDGLRMLSNFVEFA